MKALNIVQPELQELAGLQLAELLHGIRVELKSIGGWQAEDRGTARQGPAARSDQNCWDEAGKSGPRSTARMTPAMAQTPPEPPGALMSDVPPGY